MKEEYIGDTLTAEYNNRNRDWDVVATQAMVHDEPSDELEESKMRSKAMLIIAKSNWSSKAWNRVMKRFIKCVNKLGE
jgi:hypothetical protein